MSGVHLQDSSRIYVVALRLKRVARASAWVLLVGIIVSVVSGWGITQTSVIYRLSFGLIDRRLADAIHRATNVPLAFFFLVHVLINIKLAILERKPTAGWLPNIVLIVIGIVLMVVMVYMEYFRLGG